MAVVGAQNNIPQNNNQSNAAKDYCNCGRACQEMSPHCKCNHDDKYKVLDVQKTISVQVYTCYFSSCMCTTLCTILQLNKWNIKQKVVSSLWNSCACMTKKCHQKESRAQTGFGKWEHFLFQSSSAHNTAPHTSSDTRQVSHLYESNSGFVSLRSFLWSISWLQCSFCHLF